MIEWIRNNRETGRLIPQVMDESRTPLQDDIADFLFMISLHHELDEPVELLKECRRILKPGGNPCMMVRTSACFVKFLPESVFHSGLFPTLTGKTPEG